MPFPLFIVLHDVEANTYSRDLIPSLDARNLHRLFEVSPRSYNRSKVVCDHLSVMSVCYKHATPLIGIHMVSRRGASPDVRSVVRCIEKNHRELRAGGRSRLAKNVALAGVGLGALALAHHMLTAEKKKAVVPPPPPPVPEPEPEEEENKKRKSPSSESEMIPRARKRRKGEKKKIKKTSPPIY